MIVRRETQDGRVRWAARPFDTVLHKQVWLGTFESKQQARAEALDYLQNRVGGGMLRASFAEWCSQYPDRFCRDAAHNTYRNYTYAAKRLAEEFAGVPLQEMSPARIVGSDESGRPVTVHDRAMGLPMTTVSVARTMMGEAIRRGFARDPNPFARLGRSRGPGRKNLDVMPEADVIRLADSAVEVHGEYGETFRAYLLFLAFVACRPAEARALDVEDFHGDEVLLRYTKNRRPRQVAVPPIVQEAVRRMPVPLRGELFRNRKGRGFTRTTEFCYWDRVRRHFGCPDMDLYELRHTGATMMLARGASPADVAHQLGHTDGGVLVMALYGHPAESGARERNKALWRSPVGLRPVRDEEAANG